MIFLSDEEINETEKFSKKGIYEKRLRIDNH